MLLVYVAAYNSKNIYQRDDNLEVMCLYDKLSC